MTRPRPRFTPQLVELEGRDVPAWWAVTAPAPTAGSPGSTDAAHAGGLTFNPDHTPAAGKVTVWADTPVAAAAEALRGTVTVTLGGTAVAQAFGPDTVGTPADRKAFAVAVSGSTVTVALEDMAGFPGVTPDWDYNDRMWGGATVAATIAPVIYEDTSVWVSPQGETATVRMKTELRADDEFHWTYDITNDGLSTATPNVFGLSVVGLTGFDVAAMSDFAFSKPQWGVRVTANAVSWYRDGGGYGENFVGIGETVRAEFNTPPRPLVGGSGSAGTAYSLFESDGGQAAGRGVQPMSLQSPVAEGKARGPGPQIKAALQSVTFSGATNFMIAADPGDKDYIGPEHWLDKDINGLIDKLPDRILPVGFVRTDQVKVAAKLVVTAGGADTKFVYVRADGPGNYDVPWTLAPVANGVIDLPATPLTSRLVDAVDYIEKFEFKWEVAQFLRFGPTAAGVSTNEFFATLAAPAPPAGHGIYVTPLWLFCKWAKGTVNEATAIPKAWTAFEGKSVKTHQDLDPLRNILSKPVYYYNSWLTQNESIVQLLTSKDGKCQAWVELFGFQLLEGGIPLAMLTRHRIVRKVEPEKGLLFINSFQFTPVGTANKPPYTHANVLSPPPATDSGWALDSYIAQDQTTKAWGYKWGPNPEVTDMAGTAGQNTANPRSIFTSHFVVRIGNVIYDPSYGSKFSQAAGGAGDAWEAACNAWEDGSLAGIGEASSYLDNNNMPRDKLIIRKPVANVRDTDIQPG